MTGGWDGRSHPTRGGLGAPSMALASVGASLARHPGEVGLPGERLSTVGGVLTAQFDAVGLVHDDGLSVVGRVSGGSRGARRSGPCRDDPVGADRVGRRAGVGGGSSAVRSGRCRSDSADRRRDAAEVRWVADRRAGREALEAVDGDHDCRTSFRSRAKFDCIVAPLGLPFQRGFALGARSRR